MSRGDWWERFLSWLIVFLQRLSLRVGGNDPDEWTLVIVHNDDMPGMWIREEHQDEDWAAFHALTGQ